MGQGTQLAERWDPPDRLGVVDGLEYDASPVDRPWCRFTPVLGSPRQEHRDCRQNLGCRPAGAVRATRCCAPELQEGTEKRTRRRRRPESLHRTSLRDLDARAQLLGDRFETPRGCGDEPEVEPGAVDRSVLCAGAIDEDRARLEIELAPAASPCPPRNGGQNHSIVVDGSSIEHRKPDSTGGGSEPILLGDEHGVGPCPGSALTPSISTPATDSESASASETT